MSGEPLVYRENVNNVTSNMSISNSCMFQDSFSNKYLIKGEIFLKKEFNGTVEEIDIGKNLVTLDASVLLARLMKNNEEPDHGLFALAIGSGDPAWDPRNPPSSAAVNTKTELVNEIARKEFSKVSFIKIPTDGSPYETDTPTNVLDLTTTFGPGEAEDYWMEMGLYGGDATLVKDSGTLVTYKNFGLVTKNPGSTYTITYRLTF